MARTRAEVNVVYKKYLVVKDDFPNASQLGKYLDIAPNVIRNWNNGSIPLPDANPKPQSFYNDRARDGYIAEPKITIEIANNIPTNDEIYYLLTQGCSVEYIAMRLHKTVEVVAHTKAYFLKENIINPSQMNADLTLKEIALVLGFSEAETNKLYRSGLNKIMNAIGDINDLVAEPNDDDCYRDSKGGASRHYSSMAN